MKKILFSFVLSMITFAVFGQHETLFNKVKLRGAFGGPIHEWGIGENAGNSVGGGGAVIFNNFFIGAYGMGEFDFDRVLVDDIEDLRMGHGGFWFGATFPTYKLVHGYASLRTGWGAVNIDLNDPSYSPNDTDAIFVVTPEIGLELNVTQWFRMSGSVGYRSVSGVSNNFGYDNKDFSGATAALTLRFGWFGWKKW